MDSFIKLTLTIFVLNCKKMSRQTMQKVSFCQTILQQQNTETITFLTLLSFPPFSADYLYKNSSTNHFQSNNFTQTKCFHFARTHPRSLSQQQSLKSLRSLWMVLLSDVLQSFVFPFIRKSLKLSAHQGYVSV